MYDVCDLVNKQFQNILMNISISKANQAMKLDQLKGYNVRNIFLEKSLTKCGGETIPRRFLKNQKLSISLEFKILYRLFLLYAKLRTTEIY